MGAHVEDNSQRKQGYLYAVRLLTISKRSETELSKRLLSKGYPKAAIDSIIVKLKEQKILNDQKLVQETVHWAVQSKKYGRRKVYLQLKKRGIATGEIEEALDTFPKEAEHDTALMLAEERWEKLKGVDFQKRKKRLYDFLINRGFDFELSREIVKEMQPNESNENF